MSDEVVKDENTQDSDGAADDGCHVTCHRGGFWVLFFAFVVTTVASAFCLSHFKHRVDYLECKVERSSYTHFINGCRLSAAECSIDELSSRVLDLDAKVKALDKALKDHINCPVGHK